MPLVKRFNPVDVATPCHGWTFKDELCHHASYCHAYLDLLLKRIHEGKPVNADVLEKLGIDADLIEGKRR